MFVLVIGILVLLFLGKLRPQDIGNWKTGAGLAGLLGFVYAVITVTLGNCSG
jgi:hypothetical protein